MGSTFNASMYPGSSPITSQERGAIHTSIASKVVANGAGGTGSPEYKICECVNLVI